MFFMNANLVYMPIFRLRTEERKVLYSRTFAKNVYPCVEIIKATLQKPRESKKVKNNKEKNKPLPTFEKVHTPILEKIKAEKIFVDLPVHLAQPKRLNDEVLKFMRETVDSRTKRTEALLSLGSLSHRIIPVISSYFGKTNENNSIVLQETDLRPTFQTLAFRTFPDSFDRDFPQINKIIRASDYVIFDLGETIIDLDDPDHLQPRLAELQKKVKCHVVIVRSMVSNTIKNNTIENDKLLPQITHDLINNYKSLHGTAFGDYVGIKKDNLTSGGAISPGFIFYDPVKSGYYGYRGDVYEIKGKKQGDLKDFEDIIIPLVLKSAAVKRMLASGLDYLGDMNKGWALIQLIKDGTEPSKNQGKFKRISMEHYVHCMETDIEAGNIA
jgi:hypothetical protein